MYSSNGNNQWPEGLLVIENDGGDISGGNYWESSWAERGLIFMSTNGGTFRLLIPPNQRFMIAEMKKNLKYIVISVGYLNGVKCIQWLFEDKSDTPLVITIEVRACDFLFKDSNKVDPWKASVWDYENGKPKKCLEVPAYCQYVKKLPYFNLIKK